MLSSFELCHSFEFVIRHSCILIMPTDSALIEVHGLVRKFGDRAVLNDISFNVLRGIRWLSWAAVAAARARYCDT